MTASLFAAVDMLPRDPILGMTEAFNADKNPLKANLSVGVYYDENGKLPLLQCVQQAEKMLVEAGAPRGYLPIDGLAAYDIAVRELVFGKDSEPITSGRAVTVQGIGGTGGLKIGADFLKRLNPTAQLWISDPSWENHRALFESAGFAVHTYPYYDTATKSINFAGMLAALQDAPAGTVVLLHACCHNPTGYDLTDDQWTQVIDVVRARKLVPFLDMAYQGFADGVEPDGLTVRRFAATPGALFISTSFSKSFSLYGERIGALTVAAENAEEAARVLSHLKRTVRTNYSNPPTHGSKIVSMVLASPELRALWDGELAHMRVRIKEMRTAFADGIAAAVPGADFSFVKTQRGMFSYCGLNQAQMTRLREEFGVYGLDTGRICMAALNPKNLQHVIASVAAVMR